MIKERKFWLRLTRACNNKCAFCLDYTSHNNTSYSLKYLRTMIKRGYERNFNGKQRLVLSGGEPTINPNYLEIIKIGKNVGFDKIQTITNGRMFYYKKFIRQAEQVGLDEITFSLHGHTPQLHDQLTGINGSFNQAIGGLKNALSLNFIVNIDIVVNKKNYKKLLEIIKFYYKLGVTEFDLLTIMPYGRAWDENFKSLFYNLNKFKPVFQKIIEYGEKHNLVIWYNRFPVNYFEDKEYLIKDIKTKLYHEIFGERRKNFERFLQQNKKMKCLDLKRCSYCFLQDFCSQLFHYNYLINKGERIVKINKQPLCFKNKNKKNIDLSKLKSNGILNLEKFFLFYLKELNTYKSIRCEDCLKKNNCRGLSLEEIKKNGFKSLKPIKK
jgi:MoaA/NifB/PqqE/SkfB family radical SAM enzyme